MSYKDKYCHCDECDKKEHCGCDSECPDPSPCGCGNCEEKLTEFSSCNPHYFHNEGDVTNSFTLIYLFGRLVSGTVAAELGPPFVSDIQMWADKFQVDGEFLCPFLVWARNNSGQLVLVKLAPGTPKTVTVIEPPTPECKAYYVFIGRTTFPGLTNSINGINPSSSLLNSKRGTNPFNRNRNFRR